MNVMLKIYNQLPFVFFFINVFLDFKEQFIL